MAHSVGDMAWLDLTVTNAEQVKDFYADVIGWQAEGCSMGDYEDFTMMSATTGEAISGVCHAKGVNADLPPVWMPYFLVADIDQSVNSVQAKGGELLTEIKSMGGEDKYVIIKDPAGAVCALYFKAPEQD
ncbi:VOC family protein [Thalassomonas sp. M1454]|uniref:VOC family protein n=1 Tax=Thalassomonas sp. M1454 TaxID=2594477 RepID=UPI00118171FA|nr:VOC family protein [Thalassomonas sp. M1454]TRX56359.1 VOC family protein [Thalassomonas sp. M1454]